MISSVGDSFAVASAPMDGRGHRNAGAGIFGGVRGERAMRAPAKDNAGERSKTH